MGVFCSEIHSKVKETLKDRMDISKRGQDTSKKAGIYFRTVWSRMWSTANKEVMVVGGLLDGKKTKAGFDQIYSPKSEEGKPSFRPTAGITGISADYKGDMGTMRSATIKWKVWSFEELQSLQAFFLREGRTVVIEWGWSTGNKSEVVGLNTDDISDIYKSDGYIRKKIVKSGGKFDALIGLISNWSWNIQDDGSIECTTHLTSKGSAAMEVSIESNPSQKDGDRQDIKKFVANIYQKVEKGPKTGKDGSASKFISDKEAWISWGWLEDEIVTKHLSMEGKKDIRIGVMKSLTYGPDGKKMGPTLIYRPTALKTTKGDVLDIEPPSPFKSLKTEDNNGTPLRNLCINVEVVKTAFDNADSLKSALAAILTRINEAACDIWDFKIVDHEEKPGEFGVVDRNYSHARVGEAKDFAFIFPTWGRNSIVRDQTLECDLPDEMAMAVMYGANKPKDDKADLPDTSFQEGVEILVEGDKKESEQLELFDDEALADPKNRNDADDVKNDDDSTEDSAEQNQIKSLQESSDTRDTDNTTEKSKTASDEKEICQKVRGQYVKQVDFVYPIKLQLTIDGIGGLQWGNAIHTEFIPKVYKDNVVFTITGLSHQVDGDKWDCKIDTVAKINSAKK